MKKDPMVFVVSDSMGETAQLVARAVLSQFPDGSAQLRRFSHVETPGAARDVLEAAKAQTTLIIFTVIVPEVREVLLEDSERLGIIAVDIMGPAIFGMEKISGHKALLEPGLIHRLDEKYFRRVDAIEFAVQHDDGKDPRGYRRADVILLGVSRTSKTPVSMYLANRGVRVANLPLVPGIVPPPELSRVPIRKIVGLTISPGKLGQIRRERERTMGVRGDSGYSDPRRIREELNHADQLFRELGCDVIDVTDRAVEETAAVVMEMVRILRSSGVGGAS